MLHKLVMIIVVAFTLAVGSLPLAAQTGTTEAKPENVPALLNKADAAYTAKDYLAFRQTLESLRRLRPFNSQYMYQLVIAHALLDEKTQAYDLMLKMQQQGLAYDFMQTDNSMNIRGTEVFDYVNDLMKMASDPMGESELAFVLPESVVMPEAIAWDESRQKFLVGTIAEGQVIAVDKDGQIEELFRADNENGLWAIFDILVDQSRNRLWVTSATIPSFSRFDPIDKGRSALFEFDLKTLELIHRYPVPVDGRPHVLGNMVQNPNGDIFVADRVLPLVYSKPADEERLKPVLALKDLVSLRGIAMQPDGRIMYVADREMGIMVVDLVGQQARLLGVPATLNLGGIDGLYLQDNRLFVIQNGISPQRVMRLQLDASGTKVEAVRPLAVAQPEFDLPSFGAIEGENLYFYANSQLLAKEGSRKPVNVLRTGLNASEDLTSPDMKRFMQKQAEQQKQVEQEEKNN